MKTIYCISGLGADERVFANLRIHGANLLFLRWLIPEKQESIESYSGRMSLQVKDEDPIILGVSFGGIVAVEMAKQRKISKIILISSVKSKDELPAWMRISGKLNLHTLLPPRSPKWFGVIADNYLGAASEEEKLLAKKYRHDVSPVYLHWAIDKVINWQNSEIPPIPPTIFHIHGTDDRTFPIKNVRPTHIVPQGGHFMVFNKAGEIARIIENII